MAKKPTSGKTTDKPEAEVEDAEVVGEAASEPVDDTVEAKPAGRRKTKAAVPGDEPEAPVEARDEPAIEEVADEQVEDDPSDSDETPPGDDHVDSDLLDEHAEPEQADEYHDEHERRGTMASYALSGLIIFLIGAAIALWAAPRVAPHLPAGMAKYLETGSTVSGDDLADLRKAFDGRMRALESKTLSVATVTDLVDTQLRDTRTTLDARIGELADKIAAADSAAIEGRLAAVETTLAGLESRFAALSDSLTNISTGGAGLTPEDAARIAGFVAAVDGLRAEIGSLSEKSGALSQRIDEVAAAAARKVEEAEAEAEVVKTEAETAIKGMALAAGLDELEIAIRSGAPFADALGKLDAATNAPAPDALVAIAATGAPNLTALRTSFPAAAHDAIAAVIRSDGGDGFVGQASAWFNSQFTGLPVTETSGDDVPAILSRVSARLAEGDLNAALAEANTLPDVAAKALAPWKAAAERRRDALAAVEAWRVALGANG